MTSGIVPPGLRAHLEDVAVLESAAGVLAGLGGSLFACPSQDLGALVGLLSRVGALADAARVQVVREATDRGVIAGSDAASPTDWVVAQSLPADPDSPPVPGSAPIPVADAAALARVAYTCRHPDWSVLDEALLAGRVAPRVADRIVKEHTRLRDALPASMHADVLAGFITLAAAGARPADLGRFRDRLTAQYAHEGVLQARHDKLATHRAMSGFAADLDGMYHATLTLDPESHAILAPVIDVLSAPAPGTDEHGHPVRDERSADQRRADALVEMATAYQTAGKSVRRGVATRLVVTMTLDQLQQATGCALTATGEALPPETVRRMACDAGIIPVVLGSEGQPMDVGREQRLATPAQLIALAQRDKGCSFPGCQCPPGWTVAHHLLHWLHLGPTNLDNLTLLCRRHHTIVHQRGYTATITKTGVVWLIPGRSPAAPRNFDG